MNSREFGKSLEGLSAELKQEIADLKVEIRTAKSLKTNLEKLFEQGEQVIAKVTDTDTGVEAYHAAAIDTKAKIVALKTNAETLYKDIR